MSKKVSQRPVVWARRFFKGSEAWVQIITKELLVEGLDKVESKLV